MAVWNITLTEDCFSSSAKFFREPNKINKKKRKEKEKAGGFGYLSLVPASCVVPSWYRISIVESEERPLRRPNRRGLFRSVETQAQL